MLSRTAVHGSYIDVLSRRELRRPFLFASVGRFSYGPLPLALLLVVESATDSYGAAGGALAGFGLGALVAPAKARLLDRRGLRTWLSLMGSAYALACLALSAAAARFVETPWLVAMSILAGVVSPPLGPVMRSIWSTLPDLATRRLAYSLDSALEQSFFTVGPLVGTGVVAMGSAQALLVMLGLAAFVGSLGVALTAPAGGSSAARHSTARHRDKSRLISPAFGAVLAAILAVGTGLGVLDVALIARADGLGSKDATGLLFAALAVGGMVGGLLWGRWGGQGIARGWPYPIVLVLTASIVGVVDNILVLLIVLAVGGMAVAPIFVSGNVIADEVSTPERKTEALTWVNTSNNIGAVVGSALSGLLLAELSVGVALAAASIFFVLTVVGLTVASSAGVPPQVRDQSGEHAPTERPRIGGIHVSDGEEADEDAAHIHQ